MNTVLSLNNLTKSLLWGLGIILLAYLLVLCVLQVVSMSKETLLINSYRREMDELSEINKALEVNFFQTNYLKNIESLASKLNFEKTGRIRYIQVLQGPVATK